MTAELVSMASANEKKVADIAAKSVETFTGGEPPDRMPAAPRTRAASASTYHARPMHFCTGVGKEAGLLIWRVENFIPIVVNATEHGRFYTGDTYIILSSKLTRV